MTNREKISYLQRYSTLMREFDHKWEKLEQLRAVQGKITAAYGPKVGVGGSIFNNREADLLIKIADLKDDAMRTLNLALDGLENLRAILNSMETDWPVVVLQLRYMNGMTWADIADELGYSDGYVYKLHTKALAAVTI